MFLYDNSHCQKEGKPLTFKFLKWSLFEFIFFKYHMHDSTSETQDNILLAQVKDWITPPACKICGTLNSSVGFVSINMHFALCKMIMIFCQVWSSIVNCSQYLLASEWG